MWMADESACRLDLVIMPLLTLGFFCLRTQILVILAHAFEANINMQSWTEETLPTLSQTP